MSSHPKLKNAMPRSSKVDGSYEKPEGCSPSPHQGCSPGSYKFIMAPTLSRIIALSAPASLKVRSEGRCIPMMSFPTHYECKNGIASFPPSYLYAFTPQRLHQ